MLSLFLRYWQYAALTAALLWGAAEWKLHNRAEVQRGVAVERARVADSTIKANAARLAHVDTLLVHDTLRVQKAVERLVTFRDTVLAHITDTLIVQQFVTRADSAAKACSELAGDCAEFRRLTAIKVGALESKLAAMPAAERRSCVAQDIVWSLVGGLGGYVVRAATHR